MSDRETRSMTRDKATAAEKEDKRLKELEETRKMDDSFENSVSGPKPPVVNKPRSWFWGGRRIKSRKSSKSSKSKKSRKSRKSRK